MAVVNFDRTYVEIALGQTGQQFWVSVEGLPRVGLWLPATAQTHRQPRGVGSRVRRIVQRLVERGCRRDRGRHRHRVHVRARTALRAKRAHAAVHGDSAAGRVRAGSSSRARPGQGRSFTRRRRCRLSSAARSRIAEPSRPGAPRLHLGAAHGGDRRERARDLRPRLTAVWRCEDVAAVRAEVEAQAARLRVVIVPSAPAGTRPGRNGRVGRRPAPPSSCRRPRCDRRAGGRRRGRVCWSEMCGTT